MDIDQALQTFIVESRELLEAMNDGLLGIEHTQYRAELVNAIFRAAHTIKGSAGLFSLDYIVTFTHVLESVLDEAREGIVEISSELVTLLLSCGDHIGVLIDGVEAGQRGVDEATVQQGAPLLKRLGAYLHAAPLPGALQKAVQRVASATVDSDCWHISLRFGRDVLKNCLDPLSFIRHLGTLGTITGIVTLPDAIPPADEMDPESCYLGFEISFNSECDKAAIESVFEFVRDDCTVQILPPKSRISQYIRLIDELPEEPAQLGKILVQCGTLTAQELNAGLGYQSSVASAKLIGAILVEQGAVPPAVLEAALAKQQQVNALKVQNARSIRVDAEKLDRLINLVGELITAGASTDLIARRTRNVELQECNSTLSELVEQVRDNALQLRMVKIGATFSRLKRVVHDVARELGKDIELQISGEDTELDKAVVEKIGDPLMHLVRNAMDHGISAPDVRAACGKPAQGTVTLNAYHDSGNIVIQVSDDGGGLNRDKILAKAVERGLIEAGRSLSDAEVYDLIFEPGFSTAEQVTNLSGRGVGMDVVKRNITALRGSVGIASQAGQGTTVTVRLPLTLAIINGFQVGVGNTVFVVPLDMIEECVRFSSENDQEYTNLRGQVLPLIRLHALFDVEGAVGPRQSIVVIKHAGKRTGLVVDALLGEFQTLIKPLSKIFSQVKCISGSSILGSGEIALILDAPALVQQAVACEMERSARAVRGSALAVRVPDAA
jgi:two-component system, chemotaxis family, sensor kinase CheA